MVRVAGHTPVYYSGWALPVYLFCFFILNAIGFNTSQSPPVTSGCGSSRSSLPRLENGIDRFVRFCYAAAVRDEESAGLPGLHLLQLHDKTESVQHGENVLMEPLREITEAHL